MPRRRRETTTPPVDDYRHNRSARRKNNPPAGLAPTFTAAHERQVEKYQYDPHLDPHLVWAGKAEHLH
ncbi:MAG: hypothetical protein N2248_01100 [candidate division WOR-3 bacterium]|nr:hypothetical protein [candidate division WOR-3 bacterium]